MKAIRLLIVILLASTTLSMAQDGPGDRDRFEGRRRWGGGYRGGGMRYEMPSEQEWADLSSFMKEMSPKRWEIFENLPDGSLLRERTRGLFLSRYRMLVKTKTEDPALYQTLVERIKLEDTIYELVANLNKATAEKASQADLESQRNEVKTNVANLVDLGIKERRIRIERLERSLQTERQKLQEDQKNRDDLVTRRMHQFIEAGSELQRSEGNPAPTDSREGQADAASPAAPAAPQQPR
jgi:hypothetical protein